MRLFSTPALYCVSQGWRKAAIDMGITYSLVDLSIRGTTSMPKKKIPFHQGMRWNGALHADACLCIRQTSVVILQVLKKVKGSCWIPGSWMCRWHTTPL